ncbi:unnamed protein product [Pleuronectes platessa]|uniref:Uncharacterized protein n=1 Tax=Pleuronectes platessa TaxID=8262 RepID=A0A9N7TPJ7_PLEPL|nr:unnamed protein product [Pleuronectes platessa]
MLALQFAGDLCGMHPASKQTSANLVSVRSPHTFNYQAIIQMLLAKMKASGTCNDSEPFQRTWQTWQKINQNTRPRGPGELSRPHLPAQNEDKTIMTRLAATQLSHCSIMSENEIDLKILRRP